MATKMCPTRLIIALVAIPIAASQSNSAATGIAEGVRSDGDPPPGIYEHGFDDAGTRAIVNEAATLLGHLSPQKLLWAGDSELLGRLQRFFGMEKYPRVGKSQEAKELLMSCVVWGAGHGVNEALFLLGVAALEGLGEKPPRYRTWLYRVVDALLLRRLAADFAPELVHLRSGHESDGYASLGGGSQAVFPRHLATAHGYFAAGAHLGHPGCQHMLAVHHSLGIFGEGEAIVPWMLEHGKQARHDPRVLDRILRANYRPGDRVVVSQRGKTATIKNVRSNKVSSRGGETGKAALYRKVYDVKFDTNEEGEGLRDDQLNPPTIVQRPAQEEGESYHEEPPRELDGEREDDPLLNSTVAASDDFARIIQETYEDPRAILYERSAAASGHLEAQMAMGYRYLYGYGVPQKCEKAAEYYELAANQVLQWAERRGNVYTPAESTRLSYITGAHGKAYPAHFDDALLSHYRMSAKNGDIAAAVALGNIYYYGTRGVAQDLSKAADYYAKAAQQDSPVAKARLGLMQLVGAGIPRNEFAAYQNLRTAKESDIMEAFEGLGRLHLKGSKDLGITADVHEAKKFFIHAVEKGSIEAMLRLGMIHLDLAGQSNRKAEGQKRGVSSVSGSVTLNNIEANLPKFKATPIGPNERLQTGHRIEGNFLGHGRYYPGVIATARADGTFDINYDDGDTESQVPRSRLRWPASKSQGGEGDKDGDGWGSSTIAESILNPTQHLQKAISFITTAANNGNVNAQHALGLLHLGGIGFAKSCQNSVGWLKMVAERGPPGELLERALAHYSLGDLDGAVLNYLVASEAGYEVAQLNAAELLDKHVCPHYINADSAEEMRKSASACEKLAFKMYKKAAAQGNSEAKLRLGDHAYRQSRDSKADMKKAAMQYQRAADEQQAQAMYNLAYMHQKGIGVPRDLHLAKRYYDEAAETHQDARWPVALALVSMLGDLVLDIFQGAEMHAWRGVIFKTWVGKYPVETLMENEHESGLLRVLTFLYKSWVQLVESVFARTSKPTSTARSSSSESPAASTEQTTAQESFLDTLGSVVRKLGDVIVQRVAWDTIFFVSVMGILILTICIRRGLQRNRHRRLNEFLRRQRSQQRQQQQQRGGWR